MDSSRGMEGFVVSGKAAKQSRRSEGVDDSLTWKMTMMMTRRRMLPQDDDDDHSRPFAPLNQANIAHDPTSNSNSRPKPSICIPSPAGAGDGEFWLQPFQFDMSSTAHTHTPLKSPEVMSLEFPFTIAQWKELERQALIYKYMVASLPVPPHLLTLITKSPHDAAASQAPPGNGLNLRLSGRGGDAEPGRCRRTDGKKWRCSRDVAPDQKYCERHMHRGRPRSRKHVELLTKKINRHSNPSTDPPYSASPSAIDFTNNIAPGSHLFVSNLGQTSYQNQASEKAAIFGCMVPSVSSHKEPRGGLEWVMNGEPIPLHDHNETLRLSSLASFSSGEDQQTNNTWPLCFNPDTAPLSYSDRGFIDAWSGATGTDDTTPDLCGRNSVSSSVGLCPSPLSLTVGGKDAIDDDNGVSSQHGIIDAKSSDLTNWSARSSWSASSAGGPLAEVLRPRQPATADVALSDPASPVAGEGISCSTSAVTAGSSPSGVLQRGGVLSLSDSSGSDSPTPGSSGANSDIGLVWLSHGKMASSS